MSVRVYLARIGTMKLCLIIGTCVPFGLSCRGQNVCAKDELSAHWITVRATRLVVQCSLGQ